MPEYVPSSKCLRVGITGGIGSGKTTVCRIFEAFGIPVYYADDQARWLIANDPDLKTAMIDIFGPEVYLPDGTYNRALVGGIVFKDPAKLAALNAAVHPAVERHAQAWHAAQAKKGLAYTLKEAALLVESGSYKMLDKLIVVTAPEALRIRRVMERDGISEAAVQARLDSQLPEAEKVRLADFVINNDGKHSLVQQVWDLHRALTSHIS